MQDLNDQVNWIPPAGGQVIETIFPQEGLYVVVDHNMNHVIKGGAFLVGATNTGPWPYSDKQSSGTSKRQHLCNSIITCPSAAIENATK